MRFIGQSVNSVDHVPRGATYGLPQRAAQSRGNIEWIGLEVRIHGTQSLWLDRHSALFLDIDGTLLDIAPTPSEVHVPNGLADALTRACDLLGGAVALVSGRSIRDIDRLFAPLRLPAAGSHGAELRLDHDAVPVAEASVPMDDVVRSAILALAQAHPDTVVDDKGTAIALHYRRAPQLKDTLARTLRELVAAHDGRICLLPGRMVWEVKDCSCSKATAVRRLMEQPRFSGRRPVFVGDDVSDEDGFAEVERRGGLALAVAGEHSFRRGTAFADPAAVRQWLVDLPREMDS